MSDKQETITLKVRHLVLAGILALLLVGVAIGLPLVKERQEAKQVETIRTAVAAQGGTLIEAKRVKDLHLINVGVSGKVGSFLYIDGLIIPLGQGK